MQFTFNLTSKRQLKAALPHLAALLKIEQLPATEPEKPKLITDADPEEVLERVADAAERAWREATGPAQP